MQPTGLDERLGHLEQQAASTNSDLRSLFNAVEALATEVKTLVSRRPNVGMLAIIAIAVLGLIATISTLAFSPVYRSLEIHSKAIINNDDSVELQMQDIGSLKANSESLSNEYSDLLKRIYRLEDRALGGK